MRLTIWLVALISRTRVKSKRQFLGQYMILYSSRRTRYKLRSLYIETLISNTWRDKDKPVTLRNDFFFEPTQKNMLSVRRRPRKKINSYQVRRMLLEELGHR